MGAARAHRHPADHEDGRVATLRTVEDQVGVLLRRARRAIADRAASIHPDMHPAAYLVLAHVAAAGPVRGGDVGCALQIDKAVVSRYAQHLEELGLVSRSADPDDRRASLLSVTRLGRRRVDALDDARRSTLGDRLAEWSDDDLTELADVLGRYNDTLA